MVIVRRVGALARKVTFHALTFEVVVMYVKTQMYLRMKILLTLTMKMKTMNSFMRKILKYSMNFLKHPTIWLILRRMNESFGKLYFSFSLFLS